MAATYTDQSLASGYSMKIGLVRRAIRAGRLHATESGGEWTAPRLSVRDWVRRNRIYAFIGGIKRRITVNNFEDGLT